MFNANQNNLFDMKVNSDLYFSYFCNDKKYLYFVVCYLHIFIFQTPSLFHDIFLLVVMTLNDFVIIYLICIVQKIGFILTLATKNKSDCGD